MGRLTDFEKLSVSFPPLARRELGEAYIYLIGCNELTKIGFAVDVQKRIAMMQGGNPYELRLLKTWLVASPQTFEECLHAHFEQYRVRGEWFAIPEKPLFDMIVLDSLRPFLS